jgi:hypothetical protein
MFRTIVRATLLTTAALTHAASAQAADLAKLVGHWSCKGNFSNGTPIAGELSIEADAPSGALIVHHDDVAPGAYHSLEVWMPNKSGSGFRAAISDKFSGMRWLESAGWSGNTLTWIRTENGVPAEQFAYEFKVETMQVQWSVAQSGAMKIGDTLSCSHA